MVTDTFTVLDADALGVTTMATASFEVDAGALNPIALDDNFTTFAGLTLSVELGVLGNDKDIGGGVLTAALMTGPSDGTLTLNPDGSFTYVPNPNFVGVDSFTYQNIETAAPGLTHWWPADGNGVDVAGGANVASMNGVTFAPGQFGEAFSFNGQSNVELGNENLIGSGQDPFTLSMLIKPTENNEGSYYLLAGLQQDTQVILEASDDFVLPGSYIGMEFLGGTISGGFRYRPAPC